eukprot:GHVL01026570.1.p1 GENE.GHVL01026570.1~~GHVL01026570.1.p1  ORF type:complete len:534 (+),score=24.81 GHVL01026570.1:188-1789(+)
MKCFGFPRCRQKAERGLRRQMQETEAQPLTDDGVHSTEQSSLMVSQDPKHSDSLAAEREKSGFAGSDFPQFPDFGHYLPSIAWIKILTYLTEQDRLAIALSCRRLKTLCLQTPSLWRSAEVFLGISAPQPEQQNDEKRKKGKVQLLPTDRAVLRGSSRYVSRVTIWMEDVKGLKFTKKSLKALKEATKHWSLTHVQIYGVRQDKKTRANPSDCALPSSLRKLFVNFMTSERARGLKGLHVQVWPWMDDKNEMFIISLLKDATFHEGLESLTLYWVTKFSEFPEASPSELSGLTSAVGRFKSVHTLCISSSYMSDDLLLALSSSQHCPLKRLKIFDGYFPTVISCWKEFLVHSPAVMVEMSIRTFLVCATLEQSLPAEVPLVYFNLSRPVPAEDQKELMKLFPRYTNHLKGVYFESGDSMPGCEEALVAMVEGCRFLHELSFYGKIRSKDIVRLASLERGWGSFNFLTKNVAFPEQSPDVSRKKKVKKLIKEVSSKLGKAWKPCSKIRLSRSSPSINTDNIEGGRILRVRPGKA